MPNSFAAHRLLPGDERYTVGDIGFMETNVPPPLNPPGPPPIIVNTPLPPRSCTGWKVFSVLLLLLLLASVGLNFLGLIGSMFSGMGAGSTGAQSGKHFHEVVVDNPNAKSKIAILEVKGMISSEPWGRTGKSIADIVEDQLKWAAEDDDVKAVILKVDSPGGEVMASDDIANAVRKFQDKHKKPVVAQMGSLAASGGYYVSAPCQWIVANDLTLTGSIGVILHSVNYRGLMDKVGLQPVVFKSGRFKDMLSGSKKPEEQDPAEKEMIQSMIMETYQKFKNVVADGRAVAATKNKGKGKALAQNWADLADGRVLTGRQALENGFVDEIGNFETAVESTKRIAGIIGDARLIRYEEPFDISNLFSLLGKSDAKKISIDIGLAEAPKLQMGKPYFLYYPSF
jgi:protease-4